MARERRALAPLIVILGGLLYPPAAMIGLGVLSLNLLRFETWRPRMARSRADWLLTAAAIVLVLLASLPSQVAEQRFGPQVTAEQARTMPEFLAGGRDVYFKDDLYTHWILRRRSGLGATAKNPAFRDQLP